MRILGTCGGSITKGPIIFTHNDEHILLCCGTDVLVLEGRTCILVGRMESKTVSIMGKTKVRGHGEPIVSMALHPTVPGQVFSVSSDGVMCLWDYGTGVLLHQLKVPLRVASVVSAKGRTDLFIACTLEKGMKGAVVMKLDVTEIDRKEPFRQIFDTSLRTAAISLSADGRRLAIVRRSGLMIWDIENDPKRTNVQSIELDYNPIRVAIHPTDPVVFWTNGTGSIFSKNLSTIGGPSTKMHWHAHAALTLSISSDGKYLLSGGEEGVIVLWHLDSNSRQFLPHLGSNVLRVASNHAGDLYAALLRSNTIITISPGSLEIVGHYSGISAIDDNAASKIGLVRDPRNPSALLLNSIPGTLQSYDPLRGTSFDHDIDVCEQNIIGRGNHSLTFSDVYRTAFSADGRWMATYDRRMTSERTLHHDVLRFWRLKHGVYKAYNTFDAPHSAPIHQIVFAPGRIDGVYQCVTIGEDSKVKVWTSCGKRLFGIRQNGKADNRTSWACVQSITYKGLTCCAAAFSADASILAIGFGPSARLYDPLTFAYIRSLSLVGGLGAIRELLFIEDYLVGIDGAGIYVWNLAAMALVWNLHIATVHCLKSHPDGNSFVVLFENNNHVSFVALFEPYSPIPVHCYKHSSLIQSFEFTRTRWRSPPILALIDQFNIVTLLGLTDDCIVPGIEESSKYRKNHGQLAAQLAASLAAANHDDHPNTIPPLKSMVKPQLSMTSIEKVILTTVPSHHLPSTTEAFTHFIKHKFPVTIQ